MDLVQGITLLIAVAGLLLAGSREWRDRRSQKRRVELLVSHRWDRPYCWVTIMNPQPRPITVSELGMKWEDGHDWPTHPVMFSAEEGAPLEEPEDQALPRLLTDGEHIMRSIDMMDWGERDGDELPIEIYVKSVDGKRYGVPCPETIRTYVELMRRRASTDEWEAARPS
jgi:hypothetical protein